MRAPPQPLEGCAAEPGDRRRRRILLSPAARSRIYCASLHFLSYLLICIFLSRSRARAKAGASRRAAAASQSARRPAARGMDAKPSTGLVAALVAAVTVTAPTRTFSAEPERSASDRTSNERLRPSGWSLHLDNDLFAFGDQDRDYTAGI